MENWITHGKPAVVLAPMEGVTDAVMREILCARGGISFTVSEFIRVSDTPIPTKVFQREIPEYQRGWRTHSGQPVQPQLLGGNPERVAESARRAVALGAKAVDINFGCPAPLVNRHDGGAALLKSPCRIFEMVSAVRQILPAHIPVSAKLRLGWESIDDIFVNAEQAEKAGASWITIHARTRMQGYAPPVHWRHIAQVRRALSIPVVANGDIWSPEDFMRCRDITGCEHYMLGRGLVADPTLANIVSKELGLTSTHFTPMSFPAERSEWAPLLSLLADGMSLRQIEAPQIASRMKQWLKMASLRGPVPWFDQIKRAQTPEEMLSLLAR